MFVALFCATPAGLNVEGEPTSRRDQKLAIPLSAGAEVGGPTLSHFIREDALNSASRAMGHSTGVFEPQPSSVMNAKALDAFTDTSNEIPVVSASDFGGFEPFVDETVIARFLQITPRRVLEMARAGEIPRHPIGKRSRKTWRFRLSEVDAHFSFNPKTPGANLTTAVPGATRRKQ